MNIFKTMPLAGSRIFFNSLDRFAFFVLLYVCVIDFARAEIPLDKLNACSDITSLYSALNESAPMQGAVCREPETSIEKALVQRMGGATTGHRTCLMESPPAGIPSGFSCFIPHPGSGPGEMACFRASSSSDISEYKASYPERYSRAVSAYLDSASKCSSSNGDSSSAPSTLFPGFMTSVANFEFGYTLSLGKKHPTDSYILQAFASVDPTIQDGAPKAIEVIYLLVSAPAYEDPTKWKSLGNWAIGVDNADDFRVQFNASLQAQGSPIYADLISFDLRRKTATTDTVDDKINLVSSLEDKMTATASASGFRVISNAELIETTGKSYEMLREQMLSGSPYGRREKFFARTGQKFVILVSEHQSGCTHHGGLFMSMLMSMEPVPNVMSDYGNIGVMTLGIGACSQRTTVTNDFIDEYKQDMEDSLGKNLRKIQ